MVRLDRPAYLDEPATAARISPASMRDRSIRPCWRGRNTGADARPEALPGDAMRASTKRLPVPTAITAARAPPSSAVTRSSCARPRQFSRRRASATTNACAPPEMIKKIGERDVVLFLAATSANKAMMLPCSSARGLTGRRTTPARCCRSESPRSARTAADHYALPQSGFRARQIAPETSTDFLFGCAHGERVRPARTSLRNAAA